MSLLYPLFRSSTRLRELGTLEYLQYSFSNILRVNSEVLLKLVTLTHIKKWLFFIDDISCFVQKIELRYFVNLICIQEGYSFWDTRTPI